MARDFFWLQQRSDLMSGLNYPMERFDTRNMSSASQIFEDLEIHRQRHHVQAQAIQSQIDASKLLAQLNYEIIEMKVKNEAQAIELAQQTKLRENLESQRFWVTTFLACIAAVASVWALLK